MVTGIFPGQFMTVTSERDAPVFFSTPEFVFERAADVRAQQEPTWR